MPEVKRVADIGILFSFKSVAVVGASDDPGKIGGAPLFLLRKYGFEGPVYGINPKYSSVQGFPCFESPEQIPVNFDVAIYCLAADSMRGMLPRLVSKGIKGLVVFSAGFSESGAKGRELQTWLTDYSARNGIALLGPNCVGMLSFAHGTCLSFANAPSVLPKQPSGRVALLSQSSGIATNVWAEAVLNGCHFSHLIGTGNEAGFEFSDYLQYLSDDPRTDLVVGYIESLRDGLKFCKAASNLRNAGKSLVLLKAGTSPIAKSAISSHTGQLTSEDAAYEAAFDRCGVIRAHSLQELTDYVRAFPFVSANAPQVAAATTSGGIGVYIADVCDEARVEMTNFSAETESKLQGILPSFGRTKNPIDLTAQVVNDESILVKSVQVLLDDPKTDILLFALSGKGTPEQSSYVMDIFERIKKETKKPIVLCWLAVPPAIRSKAAERGLIVYDDPARFLKPLGALLRKSKVESLDLRAPLATTRGKSSAPAHDHVDIESLMTQSVDGQRVLPETASLRLLKEYGVDCPSQWQVRSAKDINRIDVAPSIQYVMKLSKPFYAHKSEVGGVITGLRTTDQLVDAWDLLRQKLNATEVIVSEQVGPGIEILCGFSRDAAFKMRTTVGTGGVWTNFADDAITLVPPFGPSYIERALQKLKIWGALSGARNQKAFAVKSLIDAVIGISRVFERLPPTIAEFECNPIIVTLDRAVVVDAIGYGVQAI